jgi:hypothetical protein
LFPVITKAGSFFNGQGWPFLGDQVMKIAKKVFMFDADGQTPIGVRWEWSDGKTTEVLLSDLGEMTPWFLANGTSQRLGDSYSGIKDVVQARARMLDDLEQTTVLGQWRAKGGAGGVSILAEALFRVMQDNPAVKDVPSLEAIAEKVRGMDAVEIRAMKRKWASIEVEIQKIKLERAKAKEVSADDDSDISELFA